MASSILIQDIIAKKAAGVERMLHRQMRIQERLADHVESDPSALSQGIKKVKDQLSKSSCPCREIYQEWETILSTKPASYIANLLRDTSSETDQLRACAPFALG